MRHASSVARRQTEQEVTGTMSLAIPYILDAAAETSPGSIVQVARRNLTAEDLNRRTIVRAEHYLREGYQPGDHLPLPPMATASQVVDVLAATRIGLVLCDGAVPALSRPNSPGADRDVVESRLWSQIPAAIIGSRTLTQGDVIRSIDNPDSEGLAQLRPVLATLHSLLAAVARDASRPLVLGDDETARPYPTP